MLVRSTLAAGNVGDGDIHLQSALETGTVGHGKFRGADVADDDGGAVDSYLGVGLDVAAHGAMDADSLGGDVGNNYAGGLHREVGLQLDIAFNPALHHQIARSREIAANLDAFANDTRCMLRCHSHAPFFGLFESPIGNARRS